MNGYTIDFTIDELENCIDLTWDAGLVKITTTTQPPPESLTVGGKIHNVNKLDVFLNWIWDTIQGILGGKAED